MYNIGILFKQIGIIRGHHGRDRMVVGFTTTTANSAFTTDVVSLNHTLARFTRYNIML